MIPWICECNDWECKCNTNMHRCQPNYRKTLYKILEYTGITSSLTEWRAPISVYSGVFRWICIPVFRDTRCIGLPSKHKLQDSHIHFHSLIAIGIAIEWIKFFQLTIDMETNMINGTILKNHGSSIMVTRE